MTKCTYCGKEYEIPRGLTYILKDGTVKHLCSSKCKKNMLMKRRKVRWILKDKRTEGDRPSVVDLKKKPEKVEEIPKEEEKDSEDKE